MHWHYSILLLLALFASSSQPFAPAVGVDAEAGRALR
jgi:hypothetical protein